jgi:hypothetical protein
MPEDISLSPREQAVRGAAAAAAGSSVPETTAAKRAGTFRVDRGPCVGVHRDNEGRALA